MDVIKNILISLLVSVPFILVGILYNNWGSKRGYFRSSKIAVIFSAVFGCLSKAYLAPSVSWWWYSVILLILITLGVHQFDRRETWYRGTFWWKREESMKKYKTKKRTANNNTSTHNKTRLSVKQKEYIKFLRDKSQKDQRAKYND